MANLTSMLASCYNRCRYTATPPAAVTTRLTLFLNEAHGDLCAMPGLERLRDDVIVVTATANKARTGLPPTVARIKAIVDRTNNFKLRQVPLTELRVTDPAQAFTGGYPMRYSVLGNLAVQVQPAAATGLWVVSSAAGDNTQKAYVESILTGGYPQPIITAGTALNGLTRVAIGARTDHVEITRFYLDAVAVGFVSLYDAAAAGNELARLPIGQTFSRYLGVEWWPIQTADVTEYADITRAITDLVKGTDEPLLPVDFHDLVVQGAVFREMVFLDDARAGIAKTEYTRQRDELVSWVMDNPDRIADIKGQARGQGWSALGPTYPAERSPWG